MSVIDLPIDVVCEFFRQAALADPPRRKKGDTIDDLYFSRSRPQGFALGWIILTHVCRQWRTIGIEHMAPLWASIVTVFQKPAIADELASRARDCDLNLNVTGWYGSPSPKQKEMHDWVVERVQRARSLYCHPPLNINRAGNTMRAALDGNHLPALRQLDLRSDPSYHNDDSLNIFELNAPYLITANLSNALPAPSSSLQNLRELQLDFAQSLSPISMKRIIDLLRVPVRLEKLSLRCTHRITAPEDPDSVADVVKLEYLTKLELVLRDADHASELLDSISAPSVIIFKLNVQLAPTESLHKLLGESIQPYLAQQPFDIVSFTTNQLILAQSHNHDGDSAGRLDSVFALYFPQVSQPKAYAEVLDVLASNSASTFSAIIRCELGPAVDHQYDPYDLERPETVTAFRAALERIGGVMVNASTVCLPGDTLHYLALELMAQQPPDSFFPALKRLGVGNGNDGLTKYTEESAGMWWDTLQEGLRNRMRSEKPVTSVVLEGKWCTREPWTHAWTRRVMESRKIGLTEKAIDVRDLLNACHYCQMNLLGIMSWI
ncbi:unnamed protein product [Peniophora sp. CBMAI 1063]|nr:unnamed protein product [Peniophora sp. CBMAI 1063]